MPRKRKKHNNISKKETHKQPKKKNIFTTNNTQNDYQKQTDVSSKKQRIIKIKKKNTSLIDYKIKENDFNEREHEYYENDIENEMEYHIDEDFMNENENEQLMCGDFFSLLTTRQMIDDQEDEDSNYQPFDRQDCRVLQHFPEYERKDWSDDPQKAKFKIGDIVVLKNDKDGDTFVVCYPSKKENYYFIKRTKTLNEFEICGDDIELAPPHNNQWQSYWSTIPVIPAPKPWLKNKGTQI